MSVLVYLLYNAATATSADFCLSETFQPRCLPGEAVIIRKAVYGRMSHDSRCLQDEEEVPALANDPRHTGCFEDVLQLVSARCSGKSDCEIRIPDPEMEKTNPCYRYTVKYLEIDYRCVKSKSQAYLILLVFYTAKSRSLGLIYFLPECISYCFWRIEEQIPIIFYLFVTTVLLYGIMF